MDFLKKLQNQPENIKKIIVWGITIVLALLFVVLWFYYSYSKIKSFSQERFIEQLNPPDFSKEFKEKEQEQDEFFKSIEEKMNSSEENMADLEELKELEELDGQDILKEENQ